jgi:hypothetical protein
MDYKLLIIDDDGNENLCMKELVPSRSFLSALTSCTKSLVACLYQINFYEQCLGSDSNLPEKEANYEG